LTVISRNLTGLIPHSCLYLSLTSVNFSITGCTYFYDYNILKTHLDGTHITQITTCGNSYIEQLAARYADENNIKLVELWTDQLIGWIPLYKKFYQLIDCGDILLVCWFGENTSVTHMINKAKRMGKEVVIIRGYHPGVFKIFQ